MSDLNIQKEIEAKRMELVAKLAEARKKLAMQKNTEGVGHELKMRELDLKIQQPKT